MILGELYLFGRETDRDPRLEFHTLKSGDFEQKQQVLQDLLHDVGGALETEETIGEVSETAATLSFRWRLPETVSQEQRLSLLREKQRDVNLNVWPDTPLAVLDGKTPGEAAADWNYRSRVMATILLMELAAEQSGSSMDFNELRAKLSLPTRDDIDPETTDMAHVPIGRLHLVQVQKLRMEELLRQFDRATSSGAPRAARRIGQELLKRLDELPAESKPGLFGAMAALADNPQQALDYNRQGRVAAEALGRSPAAWLLRELEMHLAIGNSDAAAQLFQILQTRHIREPGIAEAMYSLMVRLGMVTPDGKLRATGPTDEPPPSQAVGQAPGASGESELWTPGGPQQPGKEGDGPQIWVPGMD
jgi:hypothetical protein